MSQKKREELERQLQESSHPQLTWPQSFLRTSLRSRCWERAPHPQIHGFQGQQHVAEKVLNSSGPSLYTEVGRPGS